MDIAKIIRLVGVLFAVVAGVVTIPQAAVVIAVIGLVAGYFVEEDRRVPFLVATLALVVIPGALSSIPVVGGYLTDILTSLSSLFSAAACTVIVVTTFERIKP